MIGFIIRRLLASIPTLLAVLTLVFVLVRVVPGDPAIEAEFCTQGGEGVRGCPIAQDCNGGIARDHPYQQEDERQYREQGRYRGKQPADDEANHRAILWLCPADLT